MRVGAELGMMSEAWWVPVLALPQADPAATHRPVLLVNLDPTEPYTVVRGDTEAITIGAGTNIQDASVLHADFGQPLVIGERVTVGHQVMLHGCTIGDETLIGIGAIVLNGARIGKNCLVGAGALVTEGKEFPDGSMIIGSPAKAVRELSPEHIEGLRQSARHYMDNARRFQSGLRKLA